MFPFNKYYSLAKQPNQIHPMEEISIENKNKELDRPIQQKNVNLEMANLIENDDDKSFEDIEKEFLEMSKKKKRRVGWFAQTAA